MKRLLYALLVVASFGMILRDVFPMLMKAIEIGNVLSLMLYLMVVAPLVTIGVYRLLIWEITTAQPGQELSGKPTIMAMAFSNNTAGMVFKSENKVLREFIENLGFSADKVIEQMVDSTNMTCKRLSLSALRVERNFTDSAFSPAGVVESNKWLDGLVIARLDDEAKDHSYEVSMGHG